MGATQGLQHDDSQMRSPVAKAVITLIRDSEIDLWKGYLLIAAGDLQSQVFGTYDL